MMQPYRIGVDVGGTNTDAVVMQGKVIKGGAKHPTTVDILEGVKGAINAAIENSTVDTKLITAVMIGTTQFINAIIERKNLAKVAIIRLCGLSTQSIPPLANFPKELYDAIYGTHFYVDGGFEFTGDTAISPFNPEQIIECCKSIISKDIHSLVIIGVFSPLNPEHEKAALGIAQKYFQSQNYSIYITASKDVGGAGFIERENAATLNASVQPLAKSVISAFKQAIVELKLGGTSPCQLFISQNDGTIMSSSVIEQFPIFTFSSGPTNSMRGAAFLIAGSDSTQHNSLIVLDIGGTTCDAGMITKGFPRLASSNVQIAGVRTNFRLPDTFSVGLGGGSLVTISEQPNDKGEYDITIGPESVSYELVSKAIVFGGNCLTTTDIAVASGLLNLGDKKLLDKMNLSDKKIAAVKRKMIQMVQSCIDYIKLSKENIPIVLVGGGCSLLNDISVSDLEGVSEIIRPNLFSIANAVGSAISQVSATVEDMVDLNSISKETAVEILTKKANEECIALGGDKSHLEVFSVDSTQVSYMPGNFSRISVKVISDLVLDLIPGGDEKELPTKTQEAISIQICTSAAIGKPSSATLPILSKDLNHNDHYQHQHQLQNHPQLQKVDASAGHWNVSIEDLDYLAIGCGLLGTGGGGSTYIGKQRLRELFKKGKTVKVIHPDTLQDDDLVLCLGFMGAPFVYAEKLPNGNEFTIAIENLLKYIGKPARAIVPVEIGGSNGIEPLIAGAELGLPVVDADGMGRAFPEFDMTTPTIYGAPYIPISLADEKGNSLILSGVQNLKAVEKFLRSNCITMGCVAALALSYTGKQIKELFIRYSLSQAWRLGRGVAIAQQKKLNPITTVASHTGGKIVFAGKIQDVTRSVTEGFAQGKVTIKGMKGSGEMENQVLMIHFKNEYLVAIKQSIIQEADKTIVAIVPDLIVIADSDTGHGIFVEELRFGQCVTVLVQPCNPLLSSSVALKRVGPASFGLGDEVEFKSCGVYVPPVPLPMYFANGGGSSGSRGV